MIHIFHFFNVDFLCWTLGGIFQTWHNYNLAQGLQIYTRFDDHAFRFDELDLALWSGVCLKHKPQIVFFRFLSSVANVILLLQTLNRSWTVCFELL